MKTLIVTGVLLALGSVALGRGVTPYLPLNLEPEIEAQFERVLILAGKPAMRRPLAAATVLDALPKACAVDQQLCQRVARYLARYTHVSALTHASLEGAGQHGANDVLPNRYGLPNRSSWDASLSGYVQPNDYLLVNIGGVAYDGRQSFTGSFLSAGFSKLQLDIGYKPHWLSPLSDSSMLMSTEAPTMPSVSLSNYEPLTRFGFTYEIFEARMSRSDHIVWQNGYTSGNPRLGGIQLGIEPASGWSLSLNRLVQFGGGARHGASLTTLAEALVNPSRYSNTNANLSLTQKATNQEASVASSFLFPGTVPFAIYAEYAGEDTSRGRNNLLGDAALSWGIRLPHLPRHFDLTLEASEWQNAWYIHNIWQDGMSNDGLVISNWFGDQRVFGDGVGGRSAMARLLWDAPFGGQVQLRYRTLENQIYGVVPYQRFYEVTAGYAHPWRGIVVGTEIDSGRDVFGRSFGRISGFLRYNDSDQQLGGVLQDAESSTAAWSSTGGQLLLVAGAHYLRIRTDLTELQATTYGPYLTGPHVELGARRPVSDHSDLGARLEFDDLGGKSLIGARLIDYRYRFTGPMALLAFLGVVRYELATPAYSFYYGLGLQWRDILPHLDLGVDARFYDSIARRHVLPSDPHTNRPDSFYDISGGTASLTYHF